MTLTLTNWSDLDERRFQTRKYRLLKARLDAERANDMSIYDEALVRAHYRTYEFDPNYDPTKW
jgi:hypothetical protein